MKKRLRQAAAIGALALFGAFHAFAQPMLGRYDIGQSDHVPPPRIISPSTDTVDLRGREYLEFVWSAHEGDAVLRDHYDFRLYKGYQTLGPALVYKVELPPRQWSLRLPASFFENGQVYTCAVRQYYTGPRSRPGTQSFRVIK